jgi:serine/threonine-protein kinase
MAGENADENDNLLQGTPYRATRRLAAGGMGEIYEGVEHGNQAKVAIKLLRADLAGHADLEDRMRLEGELLGLFAHPNIVAVRGAGKTRSGRPFVAMEQLRGSSLREEMKKRGALPINRALDIATQLLCALEQVHAAGVVHRDVKPDNIMICPGPRGDQVKLLDFGIAKMIDCCVVMPLANPTQRGACIGTPRYVAPEQAQGGPVDPRADLYATGVLLYTMLAGRGPFDGLKDPLRILEAHMMAVPEAPSRFAPAPIPPALEAAVLRAMAKRPEDRFADAASFRRELAMVLGRLCIAVGPWLATAPVAGPGIMCVRPRPRPREELVPRKTTPPAARRAAPSPSRAERIVPPLPPRRTARKRARRSSISSVQVLLSAAAFAAAAGSLAMWFVR